VVLQWNTKLQIIWVRARVTLLTGQLGVDRLGTIHQRNKDAEHFASVTKSYIHHYSSAVK